MAESNTTRLDRIEEKIDKLSEAMISLARAEEKLVAVEKSTANQIERINRLSGKIDDLQHQLDTQSATVNGVNKLFWVVVVAAVGAVITQLI